MAFAVMVQCSNHSLQMLWLLSSLLPLLDEKADFFSNPSLHPRSTVQSTKLILLLLDK
jgi:hypothetical protein